MSLFDTIASTVGSLFDGDLGKAADSLSDISGSDLYKGIRSGVKFLNANNEAKEKQANESQALLGFIERNSHMQDTDREWDKGNNPGKAGFGTPNYSADYRQIQAEWSAYLTGVVDTKVVPGKRYSELN